MKFKNIERIMDYINNNETMNMHLKYATLTEYMDTIQQVKKDWPLRTDDYFPYVHPLPPSRSTLAWRWC